MKMNLSAKKLEKQQKAKQLKASRVKEVCIVR